MKKHNDDDEVTSIRHFSKTGTRYTVVVVDEKKNSVTPNYKFFLKSTHGSEYFSFFYRTNIYGSGKYRHVTNIKIFLSVDHISSVDINVFG